MYESDRRRAAPLTSLYMQRTPAARAVSPRMARTDAIQRPVEPPNPPIVESAQPVLPLGGAPIQARRPNLPSARMKTTRRLKPLLGKTRTIRSLNQRLLAPRRPRAGRASGTGNMRKARCSAASSPSATVTFHWKGRHGKSTATISPTLSAAFPPATKCGTTARAASQASTRIAIRFCGGWARGRCVQTPLHAFSTAVGLQGRTDNIQISLKGAVQDAKLCTTR